MNSLPVLSVQNLHTCLTLDDRELQVVDGVDLELYRGKTLAILGESGCGKSMTALSLMRLLPTSIGRITQGKVLLNNVDMLQLPEYEMRKLRGARIGMIFQEPTTALNPVHTVGQQIAESICLHSELQGAAVRARVEDLLVKVGIADSDRIYDSYPHQLSGGMKQRIIIAIALVGDPDVLIADEPTTALDVTIQAQVLELLKTLQQETGLAILLITHDLAVVKQVADRVAVMYAGHIVEQASCQHFFENPQHPYSRLLFQTVPSLQKKSLVLTTIKGLVPQLDQAFEGCRFADRCPLVIKICRDSLPPWQEFASAEHSFRCHLDVKQLVDQLLVDDKTHEMLQEKDDTPPILLRVADLKIHFALKKKLFFGKGEVVHAVDGVSFNIAQGRTLALVGESGCGKTSVGKAIVKLYKATAGSINYARQNTLELQMIFQDPFSSLNPRMTVFACIEEGMLAQSIERDAGKRKQRVYQLLEQVGLAADCAERYPHEFSGGQRQRISIARTLAVNPRLIICDEPTSALDVSVQAQILNLLKELQKKLGLSYLFISHDLSVVSYIADEIAVMYLGRIVEQGRVEDILHNPAHPYTQALLAAAPDLNKAAQSIEHLSGEFPSPIHPPQGCHFHERCPQVMPECRKDYPLQRDLGRGHYVSCHKIF